MDGILRTPQEGGFTMEKPPCLIQKQGLTLCRVSFWSVISILFSRGWLSVSSRIVVLFQVIYPRKPITLLERRKLHTCFL
jgi:hypothetical protein